MELIEFVFKIARRGSAIADGPRDAPCSLNLVNLCTAVRTRLTLYETSNDVEGHSGS